MTPEETLGSAASAPPPPLSAEGFSSKVTSITSAFGDPTRRSIYLFARSASIGVTAGEVASQFSVHANVARHHLDKLAAGGYLEVRVSRQGGAGRPSKRYASTDAAQALDVPVRRDDLLAGLLGRALALLPVEVAEAMAEDLGAEYGRAMAASLAPGTDGSRSFRSALHAVADALSAHGFAAHAEGDGDDLRIISESCPLGGPAAVSPVVCAVDRGMVKGMLAALYGDTEPETVRTRALGDATCVTVVHA